MVCSSTSTALAKVSKMSIALHGFCPLLLNSEFCLLLNGFEVIPSTVRLLNLSPFLALASFLILFNPKVIEIYVATCVFGSIIEKSETIAHEMRQGIGHFKGLSD